MKQLTPYLFFNGTCRQAMEFYQACFGGELMLFPYHEEASEAVPCQGPKDHVMHSSLHCPHYTLMASDVPENSQPGKNIYLSINCESMEEIQRLFNTLAQGGQILQGLQDTFWGAHFGCLVDQFGIQWMLNYEKEDKKACSNHA